MHSRIKKGNLTPHFRNLLREENPLWETTEFYRWKWEEGGPCFDGKPLDIREFDSRYPGGSAINRMYADIKREVSQLTFTCRFIP